MLTALLLGITWALQPQWVSSESVANCTREYVPSQAELQWLGNLSGWSDAAGAEAACEAWRHERRRLEKWLRQLAKRHHTDTHSDGLSHHRHACPDQARTVFLEPLRDPTLHCGGPPLNRSGWLAYPSAAELPHERVFLFDVGTAYFDAAASAERLSLASHVDALGAAGRTVAKVFAWAFRALDHTEYWRRTPRPLIPKVHFFNAPASAADTDAMNPLRMAQRVATPNDYVILRLDADGPHIGAALLQQLLGSAPLLGLVDEVFWESRGPGRPEAPGRPQPGPCGSWAGGFECLAQLRRAGVRTHAWV